MKRTLAIALLIAAAGTIGPAVVVAQEIHTEIVETIQSPSPWNQAPASFRGVPFGGDEQQLRAALGRTDCHNRQYQPAGSVRLCTPKAGLILGGITLTDEYVFRDRKLVAVNLWYRPSLWLMGLAADMENAKLDQLYPIVLAAFKEKYGAPTVTRKIESKGTEVRTPKRAGLYGSERSGPDQVVPVDFFSYSAEWRNEQMHIWIVSSREGRFSNGAIETAEWEKFRQDAAATSAKKDAAKF